jgi:hypothetical protein
MTSAPKSRADSVALAARLNRLRKKATLERKAARGMSQGLKPCIDSAPVVPGLKSRPISEASFSAASEAVPLYLAI